MKTSFSSESRAKTAIRASSVNAFSETMKRKGHDVRQLYLNDMNCVLPGMSRVRGPKVSARSMMT